VTRWCCHLLGISPSGRWWPTGAEALDSMLAIFVPVRPPKFHPHRLEDQFDPIGVVRDGLERQPCSCSTFFQIYVLLSWTHSPSCISKDVEEK